MTAFKICFPPTSVCWHSPIILPKTLDGLLDRTFAINLYMHSKRLKGLKFFVSLTPLFLAISTRNIVLRDLTNLSESCKSLNNPITFSLIKCQKSSKNFMLNSSGPGALSPLHNLRLSNTSVSVNFASRNCLLVSEMALNCRRYYYMRHCYVKNIKMLSTFKCRN